MITAQQISNLYQVVSVGKTHENYKRVVEKAELYRQLSTGEGMDKLLKKFALRESDQLFKQRVEITQHITSSTISNIMTTFEKGFRANFQKVVAYSDDKQLEELTKITNKFWGENNVENYYTQRLIELNTIDPNTYIIIEFKPFDNQIERAAPYPFEANSKEVVDFAYENHVLQYLIVKQKNKVKSVTAFDYTLYLPNETIQICEIEQPKGTNTPEWSESTISFEFLETLRTGKRFFEIKKPTPHNIGFVPAYRSGYIRDLANNGTTALAPYDCIIDFLKKSIKVNSELDLTMALLAHPLKLRYGSNCKTCEGIRTIFNESTNENETCYTCKGTGFEQTSTVAEEVVISIPNRAEDLIDLDKLVTFKSPPIEIMAFQDKYIQDLTSRAKSIMFNADLFTKSEVAQTATGANIDLQNVYDTLYKFVVHYANIWQFTVKTIAKITDLQNGLVCEMKFSKDFKLKTLNDLMLELSAANTAGASPFLRRNIEKDIARILYSEDEDEYKKYEIKERFNPFSGQSMSNIMFFLTSNLVSNRDKVLYANLGLIFDNLESRFLSESQDFYDFTFVKIKEEVEKELTVFISNLIIVTPNLLK